jgi:hypothetical protein
LSEGDLTAWQNRIVGQGVKPADQFEANPNNWRTHPQSQRDALRGSLNEVGWVQQVIENVRTGHLVDGHERVWSALQNDNAEVPFIQVDLSEDEEAYVLATLDPIGAMATADAAKLDELLHDVQTGDAAVQAMLAGLAEDAGLYQGETTPAEPEPPSEPLDDLQRKWQTELGQTWAIGQHRVLCGDSTDAAAVARLLGGAQPVGLVFDPMWDAIPSGDWTGYKRVLAFADGKRAADVIGLFGAPTWVFTWDLVTSRCTGPHRPLKRSKLALWYGDVEEFDVDGAHYGEPGEAGMVTSQWGTYEYKPDPRGKHLSDVFQLSLPRFHSQGLHQYEKPLDWMRLLIGDCFPPGPVYDPFLGSGATLIACEQLGRPCYGVEIEPRYVAYTLERAEKLGLVGHVL